jgi:hypothetical protein
LCFGGTHENPDLEEIIVSPYARAVNEVLAERERQVSEEGWTSEHDAEHTNGALALAAANYAAGEPLYYPDGQGSWPSGWTFKEAPRRRQLVKAAALILAELERIDVSDGQ